MKPTAAIWLKELLETRWFVYVAVPLFYGLPVLNIGAAQVLDRPPANLDASFMVLALGALYAALVGASEGARDTRGGTWWFWRSRPMRLGSWIAAKYACGALSVLAPTAIGLTAWGALQAYIDRYATPFTLGMLVAHTFTLLAIYSAAFALGSLTRQPVSTVILTAIFALALYFVPVLFPVLRPWGVLNMLAEWPLWHVQTPPGSHRLRVGGWIVDLPGEYPAFVAAMLALSAGGAALGGVALWRDWSLRLDRRTMTWTLGGVALLLVGVSANQLSSNLTPEAVISLGTEGGRITNQMLIAGRHGVVVTEQYPPVWSDPPAPEWIKLNAGAAVSLSGPFRPLPIELRGRLELSEDGRVIYVATDALYAGELTDHGVERVAAIDLTTLGPRGLRGSGLLVRVGQTLYVQAHGDPQTRDEMLGGSIPRYLFRFDISTPRSPRFIDVHESPSLWQQIAPDFPIQLPRVPGLDRRSRLGILLEYWDGTWPLAVEGDVVVAADNAWRGSHPGNGFRIFRISSLDDRSVRFEEIGRYEPSPLERLLARGDGDLVLESGYLFLVGTRLGVSGVTVYDLRDPSRPRRAGHYQAPGDRIHRLVGDGDGRVIAGGIRLHVLRVPDGE